MSSSAAPYVVKIKVETVPKSLRNDVYTVGRIPCPGEYVDFGDDCAARRVDSVIHCLNADPNTEVLAIVRVRG